jgi:hypothetical protein
MEQYLITVVNPVEKNITVHRRIVLTVIWSFECRIVILLNDSMYRFVPMNTNHTMIFMQDIVNQATTWRSCAM